MDVFIATLNGQCYIWKGKAKFIEFTFEINNVLFNLIELNPKGKPHAVCFCLQERLRD